MNVMSILGRLFTIHGAAFLTAIAVSLAGPALAEPLRVCATIPDLGSLTQEVGGDEVAVTVFAKGPEDPGFHPFDRFRRT